MKRILLSCAILFVGHMTFAQNINDHKITFDYIQLPLQKIDTQYDNYEVVIEHGYRTANDDSTSMFEIRRDAAISVFHELMKSYQRERDSLDVIHLRQLSDWEKKVNAGTTNPDGSALAKPAPPIYPAPPTYPIMDAPILHSEYDEQNVHQHVALAGYEQGPAEVVITISILPIRNIQITETKKGSGASTKYEYHAKYILPVGLKVQSPTQGVLMETTLFEDVQAYKMKDQKSQYDHQIYMMENKETFYRELEAYARSKALAATNDHLNNQFGFVKKSRTAEVYSVKKFKNYEYTDVTNAFTTLTFALQEVGNDRDRSGAMDKIQEAINAIMGILEESSTSDDKARINPKITAMLQCNLAELYVWQAEFDKADAIVNIAKNSGEGKAKRHARNVEGFYKDQRQRWDAHY